VPTEGGTSGGKYASRVYHNKWDAYRAKRKLQADKTTGYSKLEVVEINRLSRYGKEAPVSVADFQAWNKGKNLTGNGPWTPGTSASEAKEISKNEYRSWKDSYVSQDGKTLYWRTKVQAPAAAASASPSPSASAEAQSFGRHHRDHGHFEYKYFSRTFTAKVIKGYQVVGLKLSIGLKDVGSLGSNVG
ncbi:hypothetical protein, partial [Microbispora hainanensis]|uniref:hypothetical protein n=1 Tax=Microbispora hainanensis TaxID=568844 RepID=UPI00142F075D